MLEPLLGNINAERVLLYLQRYGQGHGAAMARTFGAPLTPIQQQLKRLEAGGVLSSRLVGKTRIYQINPLYPFGAELSGLLEKAFSFMPKADVERYFTARTRPRRQGKP